MPRREDFEIAIVCGLPLEHDAVSLVSDEVWKEDTENSDCKTGRIGQHHVVLALLPGMGKASAASTAANIRSSYRHVRLCFVVRVCGGVPQTGNKEILLGDVVVGKGIVSYDFGRQYPDGFTLKDGVESNTAKPDRHIRKQLAIFETINGRLRLQEEIASFLEKLQAKATQQGCGAKYGYPGAGEDRLFKPEYRHKHRISPSCICSTCEKGSDPVCEDAVRSSCYDLGCEAQYLVPRMRLKRKRGGEIKKAQDPAIHIGIVGSGDRVIKSGEHRDSIAKPKGIIAFEMEGAGIMEEIPCVVVKGVCDYADCHKSKKWQDFAAATAASALQAILEYMPPARSRKYSVEQVPRQGHFLVPFGRNESFIGREDILQRVIARANPVANRDDCQRTAVEGLGGIGKTQIALEAAFRLHDAYSDCSIFWVPAVEAAGFENAYREIGQSLGVTGIDEDSADVKTLVKAALSRKDAGTWLLIVDNADDADLVCGPTGLLSFLPYSRMGSILLTTRNHQITVELDLSETGVVSIPRMSQTEATELLQRSLEEDQTQDAESLTSLLDFLAYLPLAIKQASAYMAKTRMGISRYLQHCRSSDKKMIKLLSKDFEDRGRYRGIANAAATTWLISFEQISRDYPLAIQYLRFMCFLAEKEIPASLLWTADDELEADEAIGALKAYAFITERAGQELYDMHRLVRLAIHNWLENDGEFETSVTAALHQLDEVFPNPKHENRADWVQYLPHASTALKFGEYSTDNMAKSNILRKVAQSNFLLGKYQDAESLCDQVRELRTELLGAEHPNTLMSMTNLAHMLHRQGKNNEAEAIYLQVLELRIKVLGAEHPDTLGSVNNLVIMLDEQGKLNEAEAIHRQVLELQTKLSGAVHPNTLSSMHNLAIVLHRQGKLNESETIHRQTLELFTKVVGAEHPNTLFSMNSLASVLYDQGKNDESEAIHRQALELRLKVLGAEHPGTRQSIDNLAIVLRIQGKYDQAEGIRKF
ncbi:phosphorylase superfamily protein [Trichoderma gamsii]|uniref:Phosphorylase superfamily protein n=1 Tax=Trichoderma gamsii TaxID=398673 RepID=A0A2P4ZBJ2_9HYPO|nr:phosphorylase superfamily protein [Trichoderma gamsii]PON21668.1 phosphorylase superfamily protein [Trichoderma gamsii]